MRNLSLSFLTILLVTVVSGCTAARPLSGPAQLVATDGIVSKSEASPSGNVAVGKDGVKCETTRRAGSNMKKRLCTTEKEEAYKLRRTQYNFVKSTRRW